MTTILTSDSYIVHFHILDKYHIPQDFVLKLLLDVKYFLRVLLPASYMQFVSLFG